MFADEQTQPARPLRTLPQVFREGTEASKAFRTAITTARTDIRTPMSHTDLTNALHHPRPTVARLGSSNVPTSTSRPSIQYPVTPPATRPSAPVPSRPEVRTNVPLYPNRETNNAWNDSNSSPTMTRRSGKSSNGTSPTYMGEYGAQYSDPSRSTIQSIPQPAVLRQRSASSPEHIKGHGAYNMLPDKMIKADNALIPAIPIGPPIPVEKPRALRQASGNVHFTPGMCFAACSDYSNRLYR